MIDPWERPVEVANCLDLIPLVQDDHTAQNSPPSLPLSPDVNDDPPDPLTRGPHVIHHGVDSRRSPHQKQDVYRQSQTTTNISIFIMIQM